ncbi:hypothetical protein D4S03_08720 [bacterium]|nr:MAG: hypothetical protein D4S03_08720 [bacterium]
MKEVRRVVGDIIIFDLEGTYLGGDDAVDFFQNTLLPALNGGARKIILNLKRVQHTETATLNIYSKTVCGRGGQLVLLNFVSIPNYDDEEEAIASFAEKHAKPTSGD